MLVTTPGVRHGASASLRVSRAVLKRLVDQAQPSLLREASDEAVGDGCPFVGLTPRFINARRRILQPMLDSSCSETPKTKKKTAQNRPVQRFWPDSIASGAAQPPPSELAMSEGTAGPRARVRRHRGGR